MHNILPKQVARRSSVEKPSWQSRNEGVHERVNFDDTIWGFELAGGAYYDTPLRVTLVKAGSRAEHVGIRVGDLLKSINGVDTSTLTVQDAHDIIISSGIHIKLVVVAPDVEATSYLVYQDRPNLKLEEIEKKRQSDLTTKRKVFKGAKTNEAWSLSWPNVRKRSAPCRESNCFMVPSRARQPRATLSVHRVKYVVD